MTVVKYVIVNDNGEYYAGTRLHIQYDAMGVERWSDDFNYFGSEGEAVWYDTVDDARAEIENNLQYYMGEYKILEKEVRNTKL